MYHTNERNIICCIFIALNELTLIPASQDEVFVWQFLILARRDPNRWGGWQDYINTHWILYYKQDLNLGKRPVAAAKSNRTLKDFLWTNDTASDELRHLDCSY
jgi:hypothetical protein